MVFPLDYFVKLFSLYAVDFEQTNIISAADNIRLITEIKVVVVY